MTFEHTAWFLGLLILPLILVGAIWTYRRRRIAWDQLVSSRLRKTLVMTTSHWRTWTSLGLALLGLLFLVLSLARPQSGYEEQEERIRGRNILIAVDTSRSMRVTDVKPSRLDAARALCFDLLGSLPNDRIGIMAFANSPHILAPLTIDHSALRETIEQMDHSNIPEGGSNISRVVEESLKVFKETGQRSNALIIISDGEDHGPAISAAAEAAATEDVPVITIAVGNDEGGLIPDTKRNDGIFRDNKGKPVLSRMQPESLKRLAKSTDGRFATLSSSQNVSALVLRALNDIQGVDMESRTRRIANERFQWFLAPSFLLLLLSAVIRLRFNRARWSSAALTSIFIFLSVQTKLEADSLNDAVSSYSEKKYDAAEMSFTDAIATFKESDDSEDNGLLLPKIKGLVTGRKSEDIPNLYFGRGNTRYKQKNFKDAQKDFSKALLSPNKELQKEAHYNLGNTLFKQGEARLSNLQESKGDKVQEMEPIIQQWQESIDHYESTLQLDSAHKNAQANLAYVKKRLEELKQQQEQQKQQQQQEEEQDSEQKDQQDQQNQEDQEKKGDQNQDQGDQQKPGDQEENDQKEGQEGQEKKEGEGGDQQDQQNKEDGQSGEQKQDKPGQEKDGQQEQDTGEGEQNKGQQPGQQGEKRPSQLLKEGPRSDETPEQYAQRILKEGSDMLQNVQRLDTHREQTPDKNW